MQKTDAELVAAACAGDIDCFRQLYERYYSLVVGIARSHLFDEHLAEDAAQETFAVACRQLASLRNPHRIAEWLGTIGRRTAKKLARAQGNGVPIQQEPILETGSEDREAAEVREAMRKLSTRGREVIQLHYFSGLSYVEIAEALGISSQAVHGRLQRARRQLAERLANSTE